MDMMKIAKMMSGNSSVEEIETFCRTQWDANDWVGRMDISHLPSKERFESIPWQKVDCMLTKKVLETSDGTGFGLDRFAPNSAEKSYMHMHPKGDRVAVIIEGSGIFFTERDQRILMLKVEVGDVLVFPRGVVHAFWGARNAELMCYIALNPFVTFDDQAHTVKSPEAAEKLHAMGMI